MKRQQSQLSFSKPSFTVGLYQHRPVCRHWGHQREWGVVFTEDVKKGTCYPCTGRGSERAREPQKERGKKEDEEMRS